MQSRKCFCANHLTTVTDLLVILYYLCICFRAVPVTCKSGRKAIKKNRLMWSAKGFIALKTCLTSVCLFQDFSVTVIDWKSLSLLPATLCLCTTKLKWKCGQGCSWWHASVFIKCLPISARLIYASSGTSCGNIWWWQPTRTTLSPPNLNQIPLKKTYSAKKLNFLHRFREVQGILWILTQNEG